MLTGSRARVGNYPGVTVEKRLGEVELDGVGRAQVLDVPGTYSLVSRTGEEQIALGALVGLAGERRPDAVVLCVDATQLVRGLYLVLQVQELGLPVIVALTMMDEAGGVRPRSGGARPPPGLPGDPGGRAQGQGHRGAAGGGGPADHRRCGQPALAVAARPPAGGSDRARCERRSGRRCRRTGRSPTPWGCGR